MPRRLAAVVASLLLLSATGCAGAAELGEPKVASHIGQQLVADIELVAIDEPSLPVQVRLASAEVYRGASLEMPAVLASLNMSVMRRDGRQYLHITSLKPVEADRLHLFLELADGARRSVRQATLWFTPDPSPALSAPAPEHAPVVAQEPVAIDRWPAAAAPVRARQAAVAPASCPRQVSTAPAAACAVLDAKNALLRDEVGRLEDKVKLLQTAMYATPAQPAAPAPIPQPAPAKPAAAPPKVAHQEEVVQRGLPWGWIGGLGALVFVLVGAAVALRARRAATLAPPTEEEVPEAVEPVLD